MRSLMHKEANLLNVSFTKYMVELGTQPRKLMSTIWAHPLPEEMGYFCCSVSFCRLVTHNILSFLIMLLNVSLTKEEKGRVLEYSSRLRFKRNIYCHDSTYLKPCVFLGLLEIFLRRKKLSDFTKVLEYLIIYSATISGAFTVLYINMVITETQKFLSPMAALKKRKSVREVCFLKINIAHSVPCVLYPRAY